MKKILLFMACTTVTILGITPAAYAGKAGAAIGGFIGGTLVGSALSRPHDYHHPRETVVVHHTAPASTSSVSERLRKENLELCEENRYLQAKNQGLNQDIKQLQQKIDVLQDENAALQKENKQFERDIARLKKELDAVKKELAPMEKGATEKNTTDNLEK